MDTTTPCLACGSKLVELCRARDFKGAIEACYAEGVESIEPVDFDGSGAVTSGIEAVRQKTLEWEANNELHGLEVDGPFPHGDRFAVTFRIDVTPKAGPMAGQRIQMNEIGLYTTEQGRVVREEFFYSMG